MNCGLDSLVFLAQNLSIFLRFSLSICVLHFSHENQDVWLNPSPFQWLSTLLEDGECCQCHNLISLLHLTPPPYFSYILIPPIVHCLINSNAKYCGYS